MAKTTSQSKKVEDQTATPPNLTPEEAAIFQRTIAEQDDWKTITEGDVEDFSLMEDPFKLPKEAQDKVDRKQLAFRWIERKPDRIDQVRNATPPKRWWIANSITTPFLKKYVDPILGCIVNMDQMLMVKPYWMYEKHQQAKMELAEIKDQTGRIDSKDGVSDGKVEWYAGREHKIGKNDVVMADEAEVDAVLGIKDDNSGLGTLEVAE